MAAVTAATTSRNRPLTKAAHGERSTRSLVFLIALPLLVIGLAPFHVRRLRRGLRRQL